MVTLKQRMLSLGMTPTALARRAKLPVTAIDGILDDRADTAAPEADVLRRCLGLRADGTRLVSNRTFRKQAARRKARFLAAMVQGTMGLEAQGLDSADLRKLQDNTYRRLLKASSAQLW